MIAMSCFYTLILNLQLCVPVSSFNQDFYQMSLLSWHYTLGFCITDSYIFSDFFFTFILHAFHICVKGPILSPASQCVDMMKLLNNQLELIEDYEV